MLYNGLWRRRSFRCLIGVMITLFIYVTRCHWRSHPYFCVSFKGRLGNQMFQFAAAYAMSKENNMPVVIPSGLEILDTFEIPTLNHLVYLPRYSYCSCLPEYKAKLDCSYDENVTAATKNKPYFIDGFFQSWKYWRQHENDLRKIFTFKADIREKANVLLENLKSKRGKDVTSVGIHVRRGDHKDSNVVAFGKRTPDESYFRYALDYFRSRFSKVVFLLATDDIAWCEKAFNNDKDVHILRGNPAAVDMATLSLTNHSILSVGTFGWWIGWLTNGTTMYYKDIYVQGSAFSKQFKNNSLSEFIYPGWILAS